MHYYAHHIGDFRSGTSLNMTRMERWIYRDMLDVYYDTEKPLAPNLEDVCLAIGVRTDGEREMVAYILRLKFRESPEGWQHERCNAEIASYHGKAEVARTNGKSGGRPKKEPSITQPVSKITQPEPDRNPKLTGSKTNQEPITNNHKPVNIKPEKTKAPTPSALPAFAGLPVLLVSDFLVLRKQKKAAVTHTAMAGIQREADKAGLSLQAALSMCCERGWAGFKAEWVTQPTLAGAWWCNDAGILAKGNALGIAPNPGEQMQQFRGRIDATVRNAGRPSEPRCAPLLPPVLTEDPRGRKPDGMAPLKTLVRHRKQA